MCWRTDDRQADESDFFLNVGLSAKEKMKLFRLLVSSFFSAFLHKTVDCSLSQPSNQSLETITWHSRCVNLWICPHVEVVMVHI